MAKKQYVNLNFKDGTQSESSLVLLKASIDEKTPGDSNGQVGYFFIEPQGSVMALDMFPAHLRPQGFDKQPKYSISASIENKQMQEPVRIGSGAGDHYKFKYGKLADGSDAKSYPGDALEVWRKVFLRAGHMKGCPPLNIGALSADYDPVSIEFAQDGGEIEIAREHYVYDINSVVSKVNQGQSPPEHSSQTVMVAMVDRIGTRSMIEASEQVWPAKTFIGKVRDWIQTVSGGTLRWKVPNGNLTWPDDKDWVFLVRALFTKKGGAEDIRFLSSPETFVLKDTSYTHYQHPEGTACRQMKIDMDVLRKQLITLMTDDTEKITLDVKLWFIGSPYLGLANSVEPKVIVGTLHPLWGNAIGGGGIAKTVVHELGHICGLVPHYVPVYSEDKAAEESPEENGKWYYAKGGLGHHCGEGATEENGEIDGKPAKVMGGGSCIMFHAGDESAPKSFCGVCQSLLKRADLAKLGLSNVWPKGWSK